MAINDNKKRNSNSNVQLIDPNEVNTINSKYLTDIAIPQYQDMHIFVELSAYRKHRTVLQVHGGFISSDPDIKVNLLGVNQINENPNYGNFTTNYYDGSTGKYINYESFGITQINIKTNSSYIPQINIQFTDIRGVSFFNQENSPYRVLFDFPPPMFQLKVKGYYGHTLEYHMHLVKYTTEFQASSGNFIIDCQFIALTYAPLTDVLFRYIANFRLLDNVNITPDPKKKPENTYELYEKVKALFSVGAEKIKNNIDNTNIETISNELNKKQELLSILNNFKNSESFKVNNQTNNGYLGIYNIISNTSQNLRSIENIYEYDSIINEKDTIDNRLIIAIINNYNAKETLVSYKAEISKISKNLTIDDNTINKISNDNLFESLVDIRTNKVSSELSGSTNYYYIDISDFYIDINKKINDLKLKKSTINDNLNNKINDYVLDVLGMQPTIYNIFEIICNDIDRFFAEIGKVSEEAEKHHSDNYNLIINSDFKDYSHKKGSNYKEDKIYAFPLVIKTETENCIKKESRVAPLELHKKTTFPEITLINKFIDTFRKQEKISELFTQKYKTTAEGNKYWIPITPMDAAIDNGVFSDGLSPYLGKNNAIDIFNVLLQRFYVLTQNSLQNTFYFSDYNKDQNVKIRNFYAESEATNLAASIIDENLIKNIKTIVETNSTADKFYNYLKNNNSELFKFNGNSILLSNTNIYKRGDIEFQGLYISKNNNIKELIADENSENPVMQLLYELQHDKTFFSRLFFIDTLGECIGITEDNIYYIKDYVEDNDDCDRRNNYNVTSRFIGITNGDIEIDNTVNPFIGGWDSISFSKSNNETKIPYEEANFDFGNIIELWSKKLGSRINSRNYDEYIISEFLSKKDWFSKFLILYNFGFTLPILRSDNPRAFSKFLSFPTLIQVPGYMLGYLGLLADLDIHDESNEKFKIISNSGLFKANGDLNYIKADIGEINKLSKNDRKILSDFYNNNYSDSIINEIIDNIIKAYNAINIEINSDEDLEREDAWKLQLGYETKDLNEIFPELIKSYSLINFTQNLKGVNKQNSTGDLKYISLEQLNDINVNPFQPTQSSSDSYKKINDSYFKLFLSTLRSKLGSQKKNIEDKNKEFDKNVLDEDIVNQLYYSFKNINDKWISNPLKKEGYPFNGENKRLIDSFAFVDRAMNPIGDTIINPEILVDLWSDPNVSVYTVMSQLLSVNGFEFFPLQNFMNFETDDWKKSFEIDTSNKVKSSPSFICMYIGGTSSYPTTIGVESNFKDDGIVDLENENIPDFKSGCNDDFNKSSNTDDLDGQDTSDNKYYGKVKAFKVRFGTQNQSMFTDIKIDSKEYPETNESIQILSRLAGDNQQQAPIPKGQNLYNLYENRSYKATISGLGNVMIQPTQYFQLENIPLYNGAYIILGVEHNITPNKMTTSFSGTKILKYPIPRVKNSSSLFGFQGGDTDSTSAGGALGNNEEIIEDGVGVKGNPDSTKYNSLYSFKINNQDTVINNNKFNSKTLTQASKNFINNWCNKTSTFSGKRNEKFPYSNEISSKTWTANINYYTVLPNADPNHPYKVSDTTSIVGINDYKKIGELLIDWIESYSVLNNLDPNVIAAQMFVETKFKMWDYDPKEPKFGVFTLPMSSVYDLIIKNLNENPDVSINGKVIENNSTVVPKTANLTYEEIKRITKGLRNPNYKESYIYNNKKSDSDAVYNMLILHQNCIDNPEVMIKAHCRYMRLLANNCSNLTSSTLFAYKLGDKFARPSYTQSIDGAKKNKLDYNKACDYVLSIWSILGDENAILNTETNKYKKSLNNEKLKKQFSGIQYYQLLFNNGQDLAKYPNTNFNEFEANVSESEGYGISSNELREDKVFEYLSKTSNIDRIKYPEDRYFKEKTEKFQIVLHHTVSGPGIKNDVKWWLDRGNETEKAKYVATQFVVSRDGSILQLYSSMYWSYHLGLNDVKNVALNKQAIGIEIDSWGALLQSNGKWYPIATDNITKKEYANIKAGEVTNFVEYNKDNGYPNGFHGYYAFEKYTNEQITTVKNIILAIKEMYPKIDLTYQGEDNSMWGYTSSNHSDIVTSTKAFKTGIDGSGIWSHVSYRKDKSDAHPQTELINMLKTLTNKTK